MTGFPSDLLGALELFNHSVRDAPDRMCTCLDAVAGGLSASLHTVGRGFGTALETMSRGVEHPDCDVLDVPGNTGCAATGRGILALVLRPLVGQGPNGA